MQFRSKGKLLTIYFTAGYPDLNSTLEIAELLETSGADMIEIGIPYSDPISDGSIIQNSSRQALNNGMRLSLLFEQLQPLRSRVSIPVFLMGYLNPVFQFGFEAFCNKCAEVGIDGLILPDLPVKEFRKHYQHYYLENNLRNVFLISQHTEEDRIREMDELTNGFLYLVSMPSITGGAPEFGEKEEEYFNRIRKMDLKNECQIGFGIRKPQQWQLATSFHKGGIIGSAFIEMLGNDPGTLEHKIREFIKPFKS